MTPRRSGHHGWHNSLALIRRHAPHGVAEVVLASAAWLAPGLSGDFRVALVLAAIAAFVGSFVVVEAEYQSRRERRRIAQAVAAGAARQLRTVALSSTDVAEPLARPRRTVTVVDVGRGERIDVGGWQLRAELATVGEILEDARGRFAATIGTQMPFLEAEVQGVAVRALTELERAVVLAGSARDGAWRLEVLSARGLRAEPLAAFTKASVMPYVDALHEALRAAAAAIEILAVAEPLVIRDPVDAAAARAAARGAARVVVENAIAHGIAINWWEHSTLADRGDVTMRTFSDVDTLRFSGQGEDHGWSSLANMLRQEAQFVVDSASMIERDVPPSIARDFGAFAQAINAARTTAHDAGEAERAAKDARVKQLDPLTIGGRDRAVDELQRLFPERVRDIVALGDGILMRLGGA